METIRYAYPGATGPDAATNSITNLDGLTTPEQDARDYPANETDKGGRTRRRIRVEQGLQVWLSAICRTNDIYEVLLLGYGIA